MSNNLNTDVAERLREVAELLEQQDANPFRVRAYRLAAGTLEQLDTGVDEIVEQRGRDGLRELPAIGSGIAGAIDEIVSTGRWSLLERLRGTAEPEALFQTIPGIGPELAERIHDQLEVDALEALEVAAHDGRLEDVEGVGARRAAMIRAALASMLGRRGRRRHRHRDQAPPVGLLLSVDAEYRTKATEGSLPTLVPRRFNPDHEAWLPILHTDRDGWHFTALFSNTARAHRLGRTRDWVVIYYYDDDHEEGQSTVVTEIHGPMQDRRVVRGREAECREHYELTDPALAS